jgi:hypothetical protein
VCSLYLFFESFESKIARKKLQYWTHEKMSARQATSKELLPQDKWQCQRKASYRQRGNQPMKKRSATLIKSDCRNVDSMILSIGLQYGLFYELTYRTSTPAHSFACNVLHTHRVLIHRYTHIHCTLWRRCGECWASVSRVDLYWYYQPLVCLAHSMIRVPHMNKGAWKRYK